MHFCMRRTQCRIIKQWQRLCWKLYDFKRFSVHLHAETLRAASKPFLLSLPYDSDAFLWLSRIIIVAAFYLWRKPSLQKLQVAVGWMYMLEHTLFNLAVEVPTSFASKHCLIHSKQPTPSGLPPHRSLRPCNVHIRVIRKIANYPSLLILSRLLELHFPFYDHFSILLFLT